MAHVASDESLYEPSAWSVKQADVPVIDAPLQKAA